MDAAPVKLRVVVSKLSVTLVTAGVESTDRVSKLPPVAPVIVVDTEPASTYGLFAWVATDTVPVVAPSAMVMVEPLLRFTVTAPCAGLVKVAV